jgi:hypothetical protein
VSFTTFTLPWAEIPLPLQGAAVSKPPSLCTAVGAGSNVKIIMNTYFYQRRRRIYVTALEEFGR